MSFKIKSQTFIILLSFIIHFCCSSFALDDYPWKKLTTSHFSIYWRNCDNKFLDSLKDKSENYYWQICDKLNLWHQQWEGKIYIYDNKEDYHTYAHTTTWAGGHADFQYKSLKSFADAPEFFSNILPHELGHLILNEYMQGKLIPLCLQEGIAQYAEQTDQRLRTSLILKQLKQHNKIIPLDKLFAVDSKILTKIKNEYVNIFYVESAGLIDFLIKKHGKLNFSIFLKELKNDQNIKTALSWAFNYSAISDLNDKWLEEI